MIPGDALAAHRSDYNHFLDTDHPDILDPSLGFNGKDHPLFDRIIKSLRDHRCFIDLESDTMPEKVHLSVFVSHEILPE